MTDRSQTLSATPPVAKKANASKGMNVAHLLLEGRAFIALLIIIATFSFTKLFYRCQLSHYGVTYSYFWLTCHWHVTGYFEWRH